MPSPIQIRLYWADHVEHHTDVLEFSSAWEDFTLPALANLEILAEAGNRAYGSGTHWVEERNGPARQG